jgi:hypothetical protein
MLYTLERSDGETHWRHSGAPLEHDGMGDFVRCPICNTRISHRKTKSTPGFGFEIAY